MMKVIMGLPVRLELIEALGLVAGIVDAANRVHYRVAAVALFGRRVRRDRLLARCPLHSLQRVVAQVGQELSHFGNGNHLSVSVSLSGVLCLLPVSVNLVYLVRAPFVVSDAALVSVVRQWFPFRN